jgi:hypothetical protein
MQKILTIAKYTLIEALRDRFFHLHLALLLLVVPLAKYLAFFSAVQMEQNFFINLFSLFYFTLVLFPLFFIPLKVNQENSGNLMLIYRAKPLRGYEYVAGKYVGYLLLFSVEILVIFLVGKYFFNSFAILFQYCFAIFLEFSITIAAALFFGIFAQLSLAVFYTFMFFFLAHSTYEIAKMAALMHKPWLTWIGKFFYYLFPSYDYYDLLPLLIYHHRPPLSLGLLTLYTLFYTTAILLAATLYFTKREL